MKYKGQAVKGSNQEIIPIVRPDGDIIFIAESIKDWTEFDKLVPEPEVPVRLKPGGVKVEVPSDPSYVKAIEAYGELKSHYLILASLEASEDVEWDTVDMSKPETWKNYIKELKESDFSEIEISRITMGVMRANSLDENMIDEARNSFLRSRQVGEKST